MKRVKVMLMAIAVMAIAAGTLAFKARFGVCYCVTVATATTSQGTIIYTCTTAAGPGLPSTRLTCDVLRCAKFTATNALTITVCSTQPTWVDGEMTCHIDDIGLPCNLATTKMVVE